MQPIELKWFGRPGYHYSTGEWMAEGAQRQRPLPLAHQVPSPAAGQPRRLPCMDGLAQHLPPQVGAP